MPSKYAPHGRSPMGRSALDAAPPGPNPHGRGAAFNPPNRFLERWAERDPELDDPLPEDPQTQFIPDATKQLLATNDSPDIGFSTSLNVYRGCEHGCSYCFARPYHEYLGFSAGLDFETKIVVKYNAPELLRREFASPRWKPRTIMMSAATDCYQPAERKLQLTRGCLEVFAEFRNPVSLLTKNHLIARDADLLAELATHNATVAFVSVTSLDPELIGKMEPRTSRPKARLAAIRALAAAGVPTGVMIGPMVPGLTEHEMPSILEAAAEAGARWAVWTALRLPGAVLPIFLEWLSRSVPPERERRVLNHVRAMRGGKLNDSSFEHRMHPGGEHMTMVRALFKSTCRKLGLNHGRLELSTTAFRRKGDQLALFG